MRMKIFQHLRPGRVPTFVLAGLLALMVPGLLSCEKQTFHFTVPISINEPFPIDVTDTFATEAVTLTGDDIRAELDIPEGGRITGVQIKALSLTIEKDADNTATALVLTGWIDDNVGDLSKVFENETVPLVGLDLPVFGLNAVIEAGITKLRNRIKAYIDRTNTADFDIWLSGSTVPAGSRASLIANLVVDVTVQYDECLNVPTGLTGGDKCDW
jgi:hypothetical protein